MIVDTSAIVAILRDEPDARRYAEAIGAADSKKMSAANYLEAAIVIDRSRSPIGSRQFDDLISAVPIEIVAITEKEVRIAREAYRDFGKRSGHPAALNFGDCFSYALSKSSGEPLLFKGDDFSHTDVESALK